MIENKKGEIGNAVNISEGLEMKGRRDDFCGLEHISGSEMINKSGVVAGSAEFENEF